MIESESKQLLNVLSLIHQDIDILRYEYLKIIIYDKTNLERQLQDIQTKLMCLESFFSKEFGYTIIK